MRFGFFFIIACLVIFSCKKDIYSHIEFQQPQFKDSVELKARILNDTIYEKYLYELGGYKDYLILFTPNKDNVFQLFNKEGRKLREFGTLGRSGQEILNIGDFSINPQLGTLTSFHQASKDIYLFYLDSIIQNKEIFMRKINLNKFKNMTFLDAYKCVDGFLLTGGKCKVYPDGARFSLLSEQGDLRCTYDQYPVNSREATDSISNSLDWELLRIKQVVSPRGDKIAEMTEVGGILEVVGVSDVLEQQALKGYIKPHFSLNGYEQNFSEKTKFWAMKVFASDNYLYVLPCSDIYSAILPKDILVFDWKGNPIKKYKTDQNLMSIYPDEENNKLYAITRSQGLDYILVVFDF